MLRRAGPCPRGWVGVGSGPARLPERLALARRSRGRAPLLARVGAGVGAGPGVDTRAGVALRHVGGDARDERLAGALGGQSLHMGALRLG